MVAAAPPRATFTIPLPPRRGLPEALVLGPRTLVMGIVNATPDSFSDGGQHATADAALAHALRLVEEGADLLDVGGESTRPGAPEVPAEEQMRRVIPVIEKLVEGARHVPISIDTRSAEVAHAAVRAGASLVNDVSGLSFDPVMREAVASLGVPAIVMHMRGTPANMTSRTQYNDVFSDVFLELGALLDQARAAGVRHVLADPGLGFAKTPEQSAALLGATARFAALNVPIVIGASRKRFLALAAPDKFGMPVAEGRLAASVAAAALAAHLGAHVVRVHDVRACGDAVRLADLLRG